MFHMADNQSDGRLQSEKTQLESSITSFGGNELQKSSAITRTQVAEPLPPPLFAKEPKSPSSREWFSWESFRVGAGWEGSRNGGAIKFWKPITLGGAVLGGFAAFSVCVIVLLEILAKKSSSKANGGGLAFAKDADSLSTIDSFM